MLVQIVRVWKLALGKVVAQTEDEVWKLMELPAKIAHDEDASEWDGETRAYLKTLIKAV